MTFNHTLRFLGSFYLLLLIGCGSIGPNAVSNQRVDYSKHLADTGREQLLLNMVRIHLNELPQFVDVSAVTDTSTLTGMFGFMASVPQSASNMNGNVFTPNVTVTGSNSPTITYTPLFGQALVTQIAQPITVDSIAAMFDSGWGLGAVLAFSADIIGPKSYLQNAIIDDLRDLAAIHTLVVVPEKSPVTGGPGGDDSLTIYCDPTRAAPGDTDDATKRWTRLQGYFKGAYISPQQIGILPASVPGGPPNPPVPPPTTYSIELRTMPTTQPSLVIADQAVPSLRTRSALGALRTAIDYKWIEFQSKPRKNEYKSLAGGDYYFDEEPPNCPDVNTPMQYGIPPASEAEIEDQASTPPAEDPGGASPEAATSLPSVGPSMVSVAGKNAVYRAATTLPSNVASTGPASSGEPSASEMDNVYEYRRATHKPRQQSLRERILNGGLHYIIIHECVVYDLDHPSKLNAYVLVSYRGKLYWIDKDDIISQRNFQLIWMLLTIQATSSATPPPFPSILVGGH